jgi:hypothetical protein
MSTTVNNPPGGYSNDYVQIVWSFASTITVAGLVFSFSRVDATLAGVASPNHSGSSSDLERPGFSTGFSYNVQATYTRAGHSDQYVTDSGSGTTQAEPAAAAPGAISSASVTPGASGVAGVSWSASSGAAGYYVARDGSQIADTTGTSLNDSGLGAGSYHTYTITPYSKNTSGARTNGSGISASGYAGGTAPITPGTPSLSGSTGGGGQAYLSWTAASNAVSYTVNSGSHGSTSTSGTSCYFSIGYSTTDTFTVTAVSSTSTSGSASNTVSVTTGIAPPAAPGATTLTAATGAQGAINLTWTTSSGASFYYIYRDGSYVTNTTSTAYNDTGLADGSSHSYYIVPYSSNSGGSTAGSNSNTSTTTAGTAPATLPAAPGATTVSAAPGALGAIIVSWTTSSGATDYNLYRDSTLLTTLTGTSYSDTGLVNGSSHSYYVIPRATNSVGTTPGSQSNTATTTAGDLPPAPGSTTVTAATGGVGIISVSWTASSGATAYKLYRDTVLAYTGSATSFSDTGLVSASSHSYYVVPQTTSSNGTTLGPQSNTSSATAGAPPESDSVGILID